MGESFLRFAIHEPLFYVISSIFGILFILLALSYLVWMPEQEAQWQKNKVTIDSLTCSGLKDFLVKTSTITDGYGNHVKEFNYADAKFHVGDCR